MPDEFGGWVVTRTPRYVVAIGSVQVEACSSKSDGRHDRPSADREAACRPPSSPS